MSGWLDTLLAAPWLALGGSAALVLVLVAVALAVVRRRRGRIGSELKYLARDTLSDIYLPDGLGGWVHVDCLVLTDYGLLVIDLRRYPGVIFAAAGIDQWTQVLSGRSYKFDNPVPALDARIQSLRALVPEAPVYGRVVFTEESEFPKGVPDFTSSITDLAADIAGLFEGASRAPGLTDAWARVRSAAVSSPDEPETVTPADQPKRPASQRHT